MNFYLGKIKNIIYLQKLFIEDWNWANPLISNLFLEYRDENLKNKINNCFILAEKDQFKVLFFEFNLSNPDKELKIYEKKLINEPEVKKYINQSIFLFASENFNYLDFVFAENVGKRIKIKRFSITPDNKNKLRTPSEQLLNLKLSSEENYSSIKNKIERTFSVDIITENFYKEYIEIFNEIKSCLVKQKLDIENKQKKLRDFIHQFLNRLIFIYFVQKRGCFDNNKNFLADFWDYYKSKFKGENRFHKEWLNVLFFESLSQPSSIYKDKKYLDDFNEILKNAPYLNGGLFEKNIELDYLDWIIPDELIEKIFEFFESYNFTVEESTPFDIDISINPEILGNIYEYLVNIEEGEERSKAGIFYTPKVEIDLMVRQSLVEFLFNKLKIDKSKLYQFIFQEEKEQIYCPFNDEEAKRVLDELENIFILDPACGSGHYLVVVLQILYELKEILFNRLNIKNYNKYNEKKKIIEKNIYGNDIKEWAVEVAKLRLWLDLFVDAENDLILNQTEPILPNLNFKIRCGDSLIQRIGKETIPLRKFIYLEKREKELLDLIKKNKLKVYENKMDFKSVLAQEKDLLLRIIKIQKINLTKEIQSLNVRQSSLLDDDYDYKSKNQINLEKEKELKQKELESLNQFENYLKEFLIKNKEIPMIWDLAFAEVFEIKNGFDIVIANPPYVRQEKIEDLTGFYKKDYKQKLIEQIIKDWSYDFDGKIIKNPISNFDKKSDLYIYFYLKGLKLLNPDGILCYISSNSWLDVGYGKFFQEVLLKKVPVVAIYDNQAKRSFKHADVNTIIVILKAPKEKDFDEEIKENEVKFIMFKKPFEEIMYSEIFIDLEKNEGFKGFQEGKRKENEIYRLHLVNQKDLYEFGKDEKIGEYIGNKWGGKYLRAPEIYWKILEKGRGKLVRLGDIAEVKFGIKTGANEFFYVEDITDKVEDE